MSDLPNDWFTWRGEVDQKLRDMKASNDDLRERVLEVEKTLVQAIVDLRSQMTRSGVVMGVLGAVGTALITACVQYLMRK